jgi:hypothetical protein
MKKAMEEGDSGIFLFHFQQNHPFPHLPIVEMFYACHIWSYILDVHLET